MNTPPTAPLQAASAGRGPIRDQDAGPRRRAGRAVPGRRHRTGQPARQSLTAGQGRQRRWSLGRPAATLSTEGFRSPTRPFRHRRGPALMRRRGLRYPAETVAPTGCAHFAPAMTQRDDIHGTSPHVRGETPVGSEPTTYALRGHRANSPALPPAPMRHHRLPDALSEQGQRPGSCQKSCHPPAAAMTRRRGTGATRRRPRPLRRRGARTPSP